MVYKPPVYTPFQRSTPGLLPPQRSDLDLAKSFVWVALALAGAGTWFSSSALAQGPNSERLRNTPLIERIDQLGRSFFDGLIPTFQRRPARQPIPDPRTQQTHPAGSLNRSSPARVGSGVTGNSSPAALGRQNVPGVWSDADIQYGRHSSAQAAGRLEQQSAVRADSSYSLHSDSAHSSADPLARRLHERLATLRESAFNGSGDSESDASDESRTDPSTEGPEPLMADGPPLDSSQQLSTQSGTVPAQTVVPRKAGIQPTARQRAISQAVQQNSHVGGDLPAAQPADELPRDGRRIEDSGSPTDAVAEQVRSSSSALPSERRSDSRPNGQDGGDSILFARQSPILDVKTVGPRQIAVGKESTYELAVRNSGLVAADQVVITIDLPDWAEVLGARPSAGTTSMAGSVEAARPLQWSVGRLEAKAQEELVLRIVPRQNRPLDLVVKWDYLPVASQAVIEVQQPRLEMRLDGPREILYGQPEIYRLELFNSGNGKAENLEISLLPLGTGNNLPATHNLGTLAPNEKKTVEVELTARQVGTITVQVDAQGDGETQAHLSEQIVVLRPALELDIEAPQVQYLNTDATYRICVSNSGTAPAKNLRLKATIPAGTEYVSSLRNGQLGPDRSQLTWTLDSLAPGAEETFALTCILREAGSSDLEADCVADGEVTARADASTIVRTIPDLVLKVSDPTGPVPVGSETTYDVVVQNRGTEGAEDVEVVAYFSHGIEPTSVEGGRHRIGPGQVVFEKIPSLAVGQSVGFKIKARAEKAGNHIFRAEVHCKQSGTRLVSEETTHFYDDQLVSQQGQGEHNSPPSKVVHTADRRRPTEGASEIGQAGASSAPSSETRRPASGED